MCDAYVPFLHVIYSPFLQPGENVQNHILNLEAPTCGSGFALLFLRQNKYSSTMLKPSISLKLQHTGKKILIYLQLWPYLHVSYIP